jgi:sporulation protein YlmC with PRC-barrel domain
MSASEKYGTSVPPIPTDRSKAAGAKIIGGDYHDDGPGPAVMTADTLDGNSVVNLQGEDIGTITDIMLDVRGGRIAYAVMSSGGFLGIGDRLFALPWSALTLDAERKCFVIDVDRAKLEKAPGFDKDKWPAMADMRWATDVHGYYGVRPYWQDRNSIQ